MSLIKCSDCGKEISDMSTSCIHCGRPVEKKVYCRECGSELSSSNSRCNNCGYQPNNNFHVNNNPNNLYENTNMSNMPKKQDNTNNLCLAGMIIGIVSFFIDFFGLVSLTGLTLSIVGYNQVKNTEGSNVNRARIGMVCSGIELVIKFFQLMSLLTY